jgi:hypothetical protein
MDEKQANQFIGYAVLLIVTYYILQMIVPLLWWVVVIMVFWRVYLEYHKHK